MVEMEAGHELDALVAERVMGLVPCYGWQRLNPQTLWLPNGPCKHGPCFPREEPPQYSRNWSAAGQVADLLMAKGYQFTLTTYELGPEKLCAVFFREHNQWEGFADTAPHAISLAAMEAAA